MNNRKYQKGFTLIELTLYTGLVGIYLLFMSQVFVSIMSVKLETESTSPVYQDIHYIIRRLSYDTHRASRIITPLVGQSGSTVTLGIMEDGAERTYQYTLTGAVLTLSDGVTVDRIHDPSTDITQCTITRIGNSGSNPMAKDTLQIQLTATSNNQSVSGQKSMSIQTTVGMR